MSPGAFLFLTAQDKSMESKFPVLTEQGDKEVDKPRP